MTSKKKMQIITRNGIKLSIPFSNLEKVTLPDLCIKGHYRRLILTQTNMNKEIQKLKKQL